MKFPWENKKQHKRRIIAQNRSQGKNAENMFVLSNIGNKVERTGRGSDYKVTKTDPWTGKKTTVYHEVKSGRAKTSKLQNKTKKKMKGRYRVTRVGFGF